MTWQLLSLSECNDRSFLYFLHHRPFWNCSPNLYFSGSVHLNLLGNFQNCIVACGSDFVGVVVLSNVSALNSSRHCSLFVISVVLVGVQSSDCLYVKQSQMHSHLG